MTDEKTRASESVARLGTGISSWVPNLYYDLIARVVPGFVVATTLGVVLAGPAPSWRSIREMVSSETQPSIFLLLLIGLPIAYTVSVICYGLDRALRKRIRHSSMAAHEWPDDFSMKYDFIKSKQPSTGNEAGKLRAEVHMTHVLQTGWVLTLLIGLARISGSTTLGELELLGIVFVCIFAAGSTRSHLHGRLIKKIANYARILGYDEPPPVTDGVVKRAKKTKKAKTTRKAKATKKTTKKRAKKA